MSVSLVWAQVSVPPAKLLMTGTAPLEVMVIIVLEEQPLELATVRL